MASSKHSPGEMTPKAVVAYAAQLRRRALSARVNDPHITLYSPSDDTARKLCSQLGPAAAKVELARRALVAEQRHEEEEARAQGGRERLRGLQLVVREEERAVRSQLTLGQRLDAVLLGLSMQSDVSAAALDGDMVSGGKPSSGLPVSRRDRERVTAVEDAVRAVERLERELSSSRRRLVERAA